jgi:hypothetical protein
MIQIKDSGESLTHKKRRLPISFKDKHKQKQGHSAVLLQSKGRTRLFNKTIMVNKVILISYLRYPNRRFFILLKFLDAVQGFGAVL